MNNLFITNYSNKKLIDKIKDSLATCNAFYFSVSFIKISGLNLILKDLKLALSRGVKGRVITSTYQNFTDIPSLEIFFNLSHDFDFECHLDYNCFGDCGFHSKGYLFEFDEDVEVVIGSSNITRYALLKNIEWNVSITSKGLEPHYKDIMSEFDNLWDKTIKLNSDIIKKYALQLEYAIEKWDMDYVQHFDKTIVPNYMQRKALKEIKRYRDFGVNRALIIAATGSGKTYLAAFDVLNFNASRLLFIVHRDTILKDAMDTFKYVFGESRTYGLFNKETKQIDRDFIFSTNASMSKNLYLFDNNVFDYIIFDEVHHIIGDTYQRILNYFTPQFILGLTATPDRMDNQSIYDLFEKNVPYELRLREALENQLVVPFKYYGINDKLIDYSESNTKDLIKQFADNLHCEFIKDQIERYRVPGKLRAIGFCKNIEHAKIMAKKMNNLGYHTTCLTGQNDTGERIRAYKELQSDTDNLEIIFTVDILNEGVDIPGINMVLFLRPTESSIIFIQQLGRGLRKCENKEYLVVLDFIGNSYSRSVQIAIALGSLSQSTIMEKQLLTSLIRDNFDSLHLPIEINIDELSKEEILKHIEKTNFNSIEFLKTDYRNFKSYIKSIRYPMHMDFLDHDYSPNIIRFIKSKTKGKQNGCYYKFLLSVEDDIPIFNEQEVVFLKYLSKFIPLVRVYEFLIIKSIIEGRNNREFIIDELKDKYSNYNESQYIHAEKILLNNLWDDSSKNNRDQYIQLSDNIYNFTNINFENEDYKIHVLDLLEYGIKRYDLEFGEFIGMFKLYGNYQTDQIKMVMGESALMQVQGTIVKPDGTVYILACLKKDANIQEHLNFNDKFLNNKVFLWESTTGVKIDNKQGLELINSNIAHIFIRKMESEDGITLPYTYIGTGKLTKPRAGLKAKPTLLFDIELDNIVPEYLKYDFNIPESDN